MHSIKLDTIYYDYIKNGKKLYETRIYDGKRKEYKLLVKIRLNLLNAKILKNLF